MRIRPKMLVAGVLIAVTLAFAGACAGGDDDTPASTSPLPSASAQASSPTGSSTAAATATRTATSPTTAPTSLAATVPVATSTATGPAVCATGNLAVTLVNSGAAAGTHFQDINMKNTGTANCLVEGFPGVTMVNSAGVQVGPAAERNPAIPSTAIVLAPGESAHAVFGIPNWQNFPDGVCGAGSAGIKIYPPGEFVAVVLPFTDRACPGFSVRVFEAGAGTANDG